MDEGNKPQNVRTSGSPFSRPASVLKLSKRKKLSLPLLIGIAVLLGVLALLYVYWFQNPNRVVAEGLSRAFNAESLTYTGVVTTAGATKMNAVLDGGASAQGGTMNAKFTFATRDKKYTFDANGLTDLGGKTYLKVRNIDGLVANYRSAVPAESRPLFDQIIAKINDKWITVGVDDLNAYNPKFAATQKCVSAAYKKLQSNKAAKTAVTATYKKHPFIVVGQTLGAKDGSLGYTLVTDDAALKAFMKEMKSAPLATSLKECDDSFKVDDNAFSQKGRTTKTEVWVSRWTHRITRVVIKDDKNGNATNLSLKPTFNQPVSVSAPKDATTLKQLQKDITSLIQTAQQPPAASVPAQ